MNTDVECIYRSCACNKSPNTVDLGFNDLICYAACNCIHLYTYKESTAPVHFQTLTWHKNSITCVQWIKYNNDIENELIATSADNTASIWTLDGSVFKLSSTLIGHTSIVRNASAMYIQDVYKKLMVATLSSDSSVKLWLRDTSTEVTCVQTISFGNGIAVDAKFAILSKPDEMILLIGADDSKIHIYAKDEENAFVPTVQLKGHEDWIRSVDIIRENQNSIMVLSASQDCHIRIWKISNTQECSVTDSDELKVDALTFSMTTGNTYSVSLESVLSGHDNWVYSARWRKHESECGNSCLQILSASMDKTVILWEFDASLNIWLEKVRLGEVGGNTLGLYGAVFSSQGDSIIAHGFQGAIHIWKLDKSEDSWLPGLSFGGHYSPVQDIAWDPNGDYLLSCSFDQTTRLHAPFIDNKQNSWYEIARPQVHGYDMVCLSLLNRFKYVSAGDEKVLRVFEAPRSFAETLKNLTKLDVEAYTKDKMAEGASVPSLGLSNKAVYEEDIVKANDSLQDQNSKRNFKDQYPDFYYTPTQITEPPTEETLLQNTLWPETQKLYGHPYEVFTVTSNHSKTLVASSCKASKLEHAGIILWCTSTWKQVAYLTFHALTVTQIEFSPNDEYLLSVSRDRMWALYKHFPNESPPYRKIANLDRKLKIHSRIIWSCSWSFDSLYFATASRDMKVALWSKSSQDVESVTEDHFSVCSKPLEVEDAATAVAFAPCMTENNRYIIAIGLENGCIVLNTWCKVSNWSMLQKLDQNIAHTLNINRLRFSSVKGEAGSKEKSSKVLQLASCGNDHHTKIYNIYIDLKT